MPYSGGIEGDKEGAYQYSSDTSLPVQDGGLQWSIGGVPLQQQLRYSASFIVRVLLHGHQNSAEHLSLNTRTLKANKWLSPIQGTGNPNQNMLSLPTLPSTQGMRCGCMLGSCFELHDTQY